MQISIIRVFTASLLGILVLTALLLFSAFTYGCTAIDGNTSVQVHKYTTYGNYMCNDTYYYTTYSKVIPYTWNCLWQLRN